MQTTAAAQLADPWHITAWHVIGYREAVYQACPGAPVQGAGCCEKCGQGIRYVVTLKGEDGRVVDVGRDCAETVLGGAELAEVRNAQRRYEEEQYRASPEYAERKAREAAAEAARAERAALAETEHALTLYGLRAIMASPAASQWERDVASGMVRRIGEGTYGGAGTWDDERAAAMAEAVWRVMFTAGMPAARHHAAAVGTRLRGVEATVYRKGAFEGTYGTTYVETLVTAAGEVLCWKGAGAWVPNGEGGERRVRIGDRVRLTGTVKQHGEYNGQPQTSVSRCKVEVV